MAQFELQKQQLDQLGASLVFIAAEKRRGIFRPAKHFTRHPISFPFLLDEDRKVAKAYGLHHRLGLDAINIARPATLVVDRNGLVQFIYRGQNQADRAPLEQVLDAVRQTANRTDQP